MPRKSADLTNITVRKVWRDGKLVDVYDVRVIDNNGKRHGARHYTKEAAILWRNKQQELSALGELGEKLQRKETLRRFTLDKLIAQYIAAHQYLFWRKRSARNEKIIIEGFRDKANVQCAKPFDSLRRDDFIDYRNMRLAAGVSPATIKRELNPIRHMLKIAKREWNIPINSADLFDGLFDGLETDNERNRPLTPNERFRLYRAIEGCRGKQQQRLWLALVRTALTLYMSRGDLLKLQWKQVDFDKGIIELPRNFTKKRVMRLLPLTVRHQSF